MGLIVSLCDDSEIMLEPWKEAGYETLGVDIKKGRDVRLLEYMGQVDAVFAFPPCTVFANSGARHLWYQSPHRTREHILEGISIMDACARFILVHKPAVWFLENPVGKMRRYLEPLLRMTFNPCDYAGYSSSEDAYTKRTMLYGEFEIPAKLPMEPIHGSKMHLKYGGRSERTKAARSLTPRGFARAFFLANAARVRAARSVA